MSVKLGNIAPNATTWTALVTGVTGKTKRLSLLFVCNRGTASSYRIAHATTTNPANAEMLFYDVAITGKTTVAIQLPITVLTPQRVMVYAESANFSFAAFGEDQ